MQRVLVPELLDSLPPSHPDALGSRRDLRVINRVMGNHRWLARRVPGLLGPGDRVLEIGAGTGELARRLEAAGVAVDGLDVADPPCDWPSGRVWHRADVRAFDGFDDYAGVVANLVLHQFTAEELASVGARIRRGKVRVLLACEPARRRIFQRLFAWFAPMCGANRVSLHDAHVSIGAGFRADELPRQLGLGARGWDNSLRYTFLGACRLVAMRRP